MKIKKILILAVVALLVCQNSPGAQSEQYIYVSRAIDFGGSVVKVISEAYTDDTISLPSDWDILSSAVKPQFMEYNGRYMLGFPKGSSAKRSFKPIGGKIVFQFDLFYADSWLTAPIVFENINGEDVLTLFFGNKGQQRAFYVKRNGEDDINLCKKSNYDLLSFAKTPMRLTMLMDTNQGYADIYIENRLAGLNIPLDRPTNNVSGFTFALEDIYEDNAIYIDCFEMGYVGAADTIDENNFLIKVNGSALKSSFYAVDDETAWIPVRTVFEALGYGVFWYDLSQSAVLTGPDHYIILKLNSIAAEKDGTKISISREVKLIDGRLMIPLDFISHLNLSGNIDEQLTLNIEN